jgi:flagellar biosynthesis/type III secretory pathway chaperone
MAERAAKEDVYWQGLERQTTKEEARWSTVMENMDLLFARVEEMDRNQQKLQANQDAATSVLQQVLKDQTSLTQQIHATGQAVAKLQTYKFRDDDSDTSSMDSPPEPNRAKSFQPHPHTLVSTLKILSTRTGNTPSMRVNTTIDLTCVK